MSEEALDLEQEEEVVVEPEFSETEQRAIEMGWSPEGIEGKDFVGAEEYIARAPIIKEMKGLKKALKNRNKDIEHLKEGFKQIQQTAYKQALDQLTKEKRIALEDQDHDKVIELDKQIIDTSREAAESETAVGRQTVMNEAYEDFVDSNDWYGSNRNMTFVADGIANELLSSGKVGENDPQLFVEVQKQMKQEFKEYFEPKARRKVSPVEGSSRSSTPSKSKYSKKDIPEQDRKIMETLVRQNVMTEQEWLEQYFTV